MTGVQLWQGGDNDAVAGMMTNAGANVDWICPGSWRVMDWVSLLQEEEHQSCPLCSGQEGGGETEPGYRGVWPR